MKKSRSRLVADLRLASGSEHHLLLFIAARGDMGENTFSIRHIRTVTGMSQSTVCRALVRLKDKGLLSWVAESLGGRNVYTINLPLIMERIAGQS